jgi:hypothetical protein
VSLPNRCRLRRPYAELQPTRSVCWEEARQYGRWINERNQRYRIKFFPGKLAEWKRLTEQAMEIVRTRDTGTLQCDIPVLAMHPGMAAR